MAIPMNFSAFRDIIRRSPNYPQFEEACAQAFGPFFMAYIEAKTDEEREKIKSELLEVTMAVTRGMMR